MGTFALLQHSAELALLRASEDPKMVAAEVEEPLRYPTITHDGSAPPPRRAVVPDFSPIRIW
ncbi:hypothetical protein [Nonomuraea sp. NPDC050691]|uniref:hypothetical protein n=1 Tax=Nonomuraea sp. NPDC050691 TaxID=3155661 RepID=UPI0033C86D5E